MLFPVWGIKQIKTLCGSSTLVKEKVKSTTLIILKVVYIYYDYMYN